MKTDNNSSEQVTKECVFCKEQFTPQRKVGARQTVCSRYECQQLRQKLNRLDWVERNPVNYQEWYQRYGKAWRQRHPDYQREYRKRRKAQTETKKCQVKSAQEVLQPLRWFYQRKKKEQLTSVKTDSDKAKHCEKKEKLTHCYYLVKARELQFFPLTVEKKEELTYSNYSP